jgi:hypothetical protein
MMAHLVAEEGLDGDEYTTMSGRTEALTRGVVTSGK